MTPVLVGTMIDTDPTVTPGENKVVTPRVSGKVWALLETHPHRDSPCSIVPVTDSQDPFSSGGGGRGGSRRAITLPLPLLPHSQVTTPTVSTKAPRRGVTVV